MLKPLLLVSALLALASSIARADIYISGHADIGVGFENDQLKLHIHAHSPLGLFGGGELGAGEHEPGDVMIGVPGPSIARPNSNDYGFLAPTAGAPVWFLPQSTSTTVTKPFLGLGTEELIQANGWTGSAPLQWTFSGITTVSGEHSEFSIWQEPTLDTPLKVFASSLDTVGSDSWLQPPNGHEHFNYGFTGQGIYDVTLTISGVNGDSSSFTDTATFRFATGSAITAVPEPTSLAMLGLVGIGFGCIRARKWRSKWLHAKS